MKKKIAIILAVAIVLVSCVALVMCNNKQEPEGQKKFTVGVCQLVQHPALDQATQGFVDGLKAELGDRVTIEVQNASGDTNVCNTIVGDFVSKNVDLIMANATPALQAAYNATAKIPILGTSITEYGVALGTTLTNGVVGGNVSGTSDLAPLDEQADMILEFMPDVKTVGIVYCSAEANSAYQVAEMKKFLAAKNVTVKEFPFSDSNDISAVVTAACAESEALYIPTDNTAASCAETIGNIVREKKIPVFTGEENPAKVCGVASLTISYYDLGVTTGKMAAKILKGEADVSTMKVEYAPATKKYNKEMCDSLGLTVPAGYEEME
ncbi:MAG: ABC transporter substrate-binding protein [Clostridia bacterium]|nr:ABC transporter substrate-binding protein [Clostridia bacterium]